MQTLKYYVSGLLLLLGLLTGCQPEMPDTAVIQIRMDVPGSPVNQSLYGLTIEEINHAVEGGIYGELIQNRSFEFGQVPLNCRYDAARNQLITPNGWSIPFIRPDSVPGWRRLDKNTYTVIDNQFLLSEKNRRSLFVYITPSDNQRTGGVIAEGFGGIPIRKDQKYDLTFYIRSSSAQPKPVQVFLTDSVGDQACSAVFTLYPACEWKKYAHTFTATETTAHARLQFSADTAVGFWLDMVSLFPENSWNGRSNGLRPEVMEAVAALNPAFIRFPGGDFVEGYTAGTYPVWHESAGPLAERRNFWNIWSYGSTNGMGFHEYLLMCEDLKAEPVYVINSGVTSQSRRPRYENIRTMDALVQDALNAIGYANDSTDTEWGAMRAKAGHDKPFGLKYIEVGSDNHGYEYERRFDLFKKAINAAYPDVTVISSCPTTGKRRSEWSDSHCYATEDFLLSQANRFDTDGYSRKTSPLFIGEFSAAGSEVPGSMRNALVEAAFLIGVENGQDKVRRLAYAPLLGNANFPFQREPALLYNGLDLLATPAYHMLNLFWNNRGDEVLKTNVTCYQRPQIIPGRAGIELFDNFYEFRDVKINHIPVDGGQILSGDWKINQGELSVVPNRWNNILLGDSSAYNYDFSASFRRVKGSGNLQFRVRDNGKPGLQNDYIGVTVGHGDVEFYRQSGGVRDTLCAPFSYPLQTGEWYAIQLICTHETIQLWINNELLREVNLHPIPAILASTAYDESRQLLLLKVVNTTRHAEKTRLEIDGGTIDNTAQIIQISGEPEAVNTFENPDLIIPREETVVFPLGGPKVYSFPPNSVTLMMLKVN